MLIRLFLDKSKGLEARVIMLRGGKYSVVFYDIDEMHYLPETHTFLSRDNAIKFAQEQTGDQQDEAPFERVGSMSIRMRSARV